MFPTTKLTALGALFSFVSFVSFALCTSPHTQYVLRQTITSSNFFDSFDLWTGNDPTEGCVDYQNYANAVQEGLIGQKNGSVYLGVDYTTNAPNRKSVRAESNFFLNFGLLVVDIVHMPANVCGAWPAFWLLGNASPWPTAGEIDIIESVNDKVKNAVTLHTSPGCVVNNDTSYTAPTRGAFPRHSEDYTGTLVTTNCDTNAADQWPNQGCSIEAPSDTDSYTGSTTHNLPSYGAPFNAIGGGVYALEWTASHIQVWFFPRDSPHMPDTTQLTASPEPATWGKPLARFSGAGCDFRARFRDLKIVFNTAFCGQWAGEGGAWAESCAAKTGVSCEEWVRDNAGAFEEVYWEIRGLRWFEEEEGGMKREAVVHRPGRRVAWW